MGSEEDRLRSEVQKKNETIQFIKWTAIIIGVLWLLKSCGPSHPRPKPEDYETMREYRQAVRDYDEARKDAEHESSQNW
jgi:hypothetical protein